MGLLVGLLIIFLIALGLIKLVMLPFRIKSFRPDFLNISFNREETTGQIFILLGILFLGETLLLLNRNLSGKTNPLWIVFTVLMVSLIVGYLIKALYPVIFGVLFMPAWWIEQSVLWIENKGINSSVVLSGLYFIIVIFYLYGRILENRKDRRQTGMVLNFISITMLSTFLFILSTRCGISLVEGSQKTGALFLSPPLAIFVILLILLSLSLFFLSALSRQRVLLPYAELIPLILLFALFTVLIFIKVPTLFNSYGHKGSTIGSSFNNAGVIWAVFLNILSFLQLLWILLLGYHRKESILINLGVLFIFLFLIFKYFSYFDFLNKGLFFIGGGILLFITGYFMEKGRRFSLQKISGDEK
jgi:hypothetical protein